MLVLGATISTVEAILHVRESTVRTSLAAVNMVANSTTIFLRTSNSLICNSMSCGPMASTTSKMSGFGLFVTLKPSGSS